MAVTKRAINPEDLSPPVGFAHGWLVESSGLCTLYFAGQCGHDRSGTVESKGDLVAQTDRAMANLGCVLRDAGLGYEDVVQLNFYLCSGDDYHVARKELGAVWRRYCGNHYPAMAMFVVVSLYDPDAVIEIQGIAAG